MKKILLFSFNGDNMLSVVQEVLSPLNIVAVEGSFKSPTQSIKELGEECVGILIDGTLPWLEVYRILVTLRTNDRTIPVATTEKNYGIAGISSKLVTIEELPYFFSQAA